MIKIEQPAPAAVLRKHKNAMDKICLYEGPADFEAHARQLISEDKLRLETGRSGWTGRKTTLDAIDMISAGDTEGTKFSDDLLSKLEKFMSLKSSRYKMVDDVAGALPNIPAFLAGHPLAMRRRQKTTNEQAPLTVTVDVSSSGSITAEQLQRRGACILAFVRALSTRRAVRLYVVITGGMHNGKNDGHHLMIPVDTAPLDVARAGYLLSHAALSRALGYRLYFADNGEEYTGMVPWNYKDADTSRENQQSIYKSILGDEVFNIPAIHTADNSVNAPEAWLEKYLTMYGGDLIESAAA